MSHGLKLALLFSLKTAITEVRYFNRQQEVRPPHDGRTVQGDHGMSELVGVGVVGYGYWGPNLVRNFATSEVAQVISVSDLDTSKLAISKRLHPAVETTTDFRDLLRDSRIEA